jgi:hypothetical protein
LQWINIVKISSIFTFKYIWLMFIIWHPEIFFIPKRNMLKGYNLKGVLCINNGIVIHKTHEFFYYDIQSCRYHQYFECNGFMQCPLMLYTSLGCIIFWLWNNFCSKFKWFWINIYHNFTFLNNWNISMWLLFLLKLHVLQVVC